MKTDLPTITSHPLALPHQSIQRCIHPELGAGVAIYENGPAKFVADSGDVVECDRIRFGSSNSLTARMVDQRFDLDTTDQAHAESHERMWSSLMGLGWLVAYVGGDIWQVRFDADSGSSLSFQWLSLSTGKTTREPKKKAELDEWNQWHRYVSTNRETLLFRKNRAPPPLVKDAKAKMVRMTEGAHARFDADTGVSFAFEVERLRAIELDHVAVCEALGYLNQAEGGGYQVAPRETIVGTVEAMKSNEVRVLEMQQGAHRWLSHGLPTGDFAGYVARALGKDEGDVSERLARDASGSPSITIAASREGVQLPPGSASFMAASSVGEDKPTGNKRCCDAGIWSSFGSYWQYCDCPLGQQARQEGRRT